MVVKHVPVSIIAPIPGFSVNDGVDIIIINKLEVSDVVNVNISNVFGYIPIAGAARLIAINCTLSIVTRTGELLYAGKIKSGTLTDGFRITINTWHKAVNDFAGNLLKKRILNF